MLGFAVLGELVRSGPKKNELYIGTNIRNYQYCIHESLYTKTILKYMQIDYKTLKCMDRKDHFEQHGLIPISSKNEITASNSAAQQILVLSCPCQTLVSTMSVCFSTTPTSTPHSILWHKPTSKIHQTSCRIERELCIFFSI